MEHNFDFEALYELLKGRNIRALREKLAGMNVVDTAEFIHELEGEERLIAFRILPKSLSADVFSYLDSDAQTAIVSAISDRELEQLMDEMFVDDAVDFLDEVPANVVRRVMQVSDPETREIINKFLQYPENSAGSIMTIEMVEFHDRLTAGEAIKQLRATAPDKETIYNCYVIDDSRHLTGVLPLRRLLLAKDGDRIREMMDKEEQVISVNTLDDQEEVADLVRKYDLISVPVVDNEGRLVGIITVDDIVDVIEEEATEDFEKMALLQPSEDTYLKTGVFKLAKNRIVWLLILMVSATFTGQIITSYETMLAAVAGLTACIPMLMDTGGNAGSQTSTLIIRGLALGELHIKDYFQILWKELRVAIICGLALAVANVGRMLLIGGTEVPVILVVSAAMVCAVMVAKIIGCTLPIVAKLVHLDPALMAGPMITTIVDAVTLMIYFALATIFLL